jgi:hypothetical protein
MPSEIASHQRLLSCKRGSTLVSYSSLMLLVAIAAIALIGPTDSRHEQEPRGAMQPLHGDRI